MSRTRLCARRVRAGDRLSLSFVDERLLDVVGHRAQRIPPVPILLEPPLGRAWNRILVSWKYTAEVCVVALRPLLSWRSQPCLVRGGDERSDHATRDNVG